VADLDAVSPDHPVYVQYLYDYALVNTAGARVLGLDGTTPPAPGIVVERDAAGRATGRLLGGVGPFNALVARILPHTRAEGTASLAGYLRELSRCGVTGVVDGSAGPAAAYLPLFALQDEGRLTVRVAYRVPAQVPGSESEFFEQLMQFRAPRTEDGFTPFVGIGEALVFGANDGVRQSPGFVVSPEARAELREVATFAASRRLPLEVHAYTDDLASQILDAFEEVNATVPIRGLRWAMAHLNTGTARTISRMRRLGMTYSVQMGPYFEAPTIAETNSLEVAQRSVARIAIDQGVTVGGGSDATRIGDYRVWPALQFHVTGTSLGGAVQRPRSQLLTRIEALRMYTRGSTYLLFDEDDRGSLEPGKLADLAVLDRPYLTVPATQIGAIRSVLTLVGGTPVHDAERQLT
jgi:predicted amidohydrolase YtcJ